jgi:oligoendopeptidase F
MKWDLTYHFKTEEDFKKEFEEVQALIQKLPAYQGKLNEPQSFKEYYNIVEEIETKGSKVYQYASLRSDLNKKDVDNAASLNNCQMMFYMLAELTSFEEPELLALGKEKVMSLIDQDPSLEQFRFAMEKLFRIEEHVLNAKSEKLLSINSPLPSTG